MQTGKRSDFSADLSALVHLVKGLSAAAGSEGSCTVQAASEECLSLSVCGDGRGAVQLAKDEGVDAAACYIDSKL